VNSHPAKAKIKTGQRRRELRMPRVRKATISESEDRRLSPARMPMRMDMGTAKARTAGMM
jgi:hypothetical protein